MARVVGTVPSPCSRRSSPPAPRRRPVSTEEMNGSGPRMTTQTDRDDSLVAALRRGEPTAAEDLVAAYGDRASRLARGITGNAQDAEEVVQDAFLSVIRRIDTFRGDATFGSWLYRIVANAAYQCCRRRRARGADVSLDKLLPVFDEHGRHVAPVADWSMRVDDPAPQIDLRIMLSAAIDELTAAPPGRGPLRAQRVSSCCYRRVLAEHRVDFLPAVDPAQLDLPARYEAEEQDQRRVFARQRALRLHAARGVVDALPADELDRAVGLVGHHPIAVHLLLEDQALSVEGPADQRGLHQGHRGETGRGHRPSIG